MSEYRYRISRRGLLGGVAGAAATASLLGNLAPSVVEAAQSGRRPTIDSIEHVVILMQENRSFDHYYGTMKGVRGFGDRASVQMPNGQDILHQPDPARADGGFLLPWHVDTRKVDGQDLDDTAHDWNSTHRAWNTGLWDRWPPAKGDLTMTYFDESDIPFQRALGQAFTVCDNYYCSVQGPTTPNRLYLWTGTIDPDGHNGGPCAANPDDYLPVFTWKTYPERLQDARISWQVYANDEVGDGGGEDGWVGDYGDNPLWLFKAYHDALNSSDPNMHQLADRASLRTQWKPNSGQGHDPKHVLAQFIADCQANRLPAVSWVVAPYAYSEHPAARPVDGAAYVQTMLSALWSNPGLAASTIVLIDYDENDGFFDHVVPPAPPAGTPHEFLAASQGGFGSPQASAGAVAPIGLGPRVPMTVVSPWSHGGWVDSEIFDHTSVLRFLEVWTGVKEPNISDWRRATCGDLTSCFDFAAPRFILPMLPDTTSLRHKADQNEAKLPTPTAPAPGRQTVPDQDKGSVPARALPYQLVADLTVTGSEIGVTMANKGSAQVQLTVYSGTIVQRFDMAPGGTASTSIATAALTGGYDVQVHGPNGFLRHASGSLLNSEAGVEASLALVGSADAPTLQLKLTNQSKASQTLNVHGLHDNPHRFVLAQHASQVVNLDPLAKNHGWYDLVVSVPASKLYERRFAGHVENGQPSRTRPN